MYSSGNRVNNISITVWRRSWRSIVKYINIKSLFCTPETNIILHVNYTLIKINKIIFKKVFKPFNSSVNFLFRKVSRLTCPQLLESGVSGSEACSQLDTLFFCLFCFVLYFKIYFKKIYILLIFYREEGRGIES
uniref:Uncharacterized protein n=1 Tax=Myotis myotis TaxID=51298 RepID=A0A7J7ZY98_MYOMY|nr:hypothetical protein mMyoMyo1_009618 [Myotis myotis]